MKCPHRVPFQKEMLMLPIEIQSGVYWIGVNDRTTDLFEGLWPIAYEGVSYNSYFIDGRTKAIIDGTKSTKVEEFFDQVRELTDISTVDYLIINHMEPDHSGLLKALRSIVPHITILCSPKAKDMLQSFYGIADNVRTVVDGETLSLGTTELKFFSTPFVHWPETIMTYDTSRRILFSCDAFGGYGAFHGALFDDEGTEATFYESEALRYFSNILTTFSRMVLRAIEKLAGTPIDVIAPSHGLIWRQDPGRIVELYKRWAGYATGRTEAGITLIYGSMYGFTETMMNAIARGISSVGIPLKIFNAARTHPSYILPSLWTRAGVMVGAPTYEGALFPLVVHVLNIAAMKRVLNKKVARFGSYGWSGGAQRNFEKIIEPLDWELTDVLEFIGKPTKEDLKRGEEFGARFAELVKAG